MSTAARKARKREGVQFVHTPKVGTPVAQRVEVVERNERHARRLVAPFLRGFVEGITRGERGER